MKIKMYKFRIYIKMQGFIFNHQDEFFEYYCHFNSPNYLIISKFEQEISIQEINEMMIQTEVIGLKTFDDFYNFTEHY